MKLKTIHNQDLRGKRVLVRLDLNVPLRDGVISDDTRILASLPTLQFLMEKGAKLILMSHFGRPKGASNPEFSLMPVAKALELYLKVPVAFASDCIGSEAHEKVAAMNDGEVLLLENLRFHPEEEENDFEFAQRLAELGDLYVNDAFGAAHRAHASVSQITNYLPSFAGLLMELELNALSGIQENPKHPVCLIVGGAKIDTKIGLLNAFLPIADTFIIGGALANTFIAAMGHEVGASLFEADKMPVAKQFLTDAKSQGKTVLLPSDLVVSETISQDAATNIRTVSDVTAAEKILDIGPKSCAAFAKAIQEAHTVIWNGPVGLYEFAPFAEGTKLIAEAVAKTSAETYLGGGDTIDAVKHFNYEFDAFTHVSTGGGAMLEFLEGQTLPGVTPLLA